MWKDLPTSHPPPSMSWVCCLRAVWTPGQITSLTFTLFLCFFSGLRLQLKVRQVKRDSTYIPTCHQMFSCGFQKQHHSLHDSLISVLQQLPKSMCILNLFFKSYQINILLIRKRMLSMTFS